MRLVIALLAAIGVIIVVGMAVAPSQPALRDIYISSLCPGLDMISVDICGALRRSASDKSL